MSKVGKNPIPLKPGVSVTVAQGTVTVQGPKGSLSLPLYPRITVKVEDESVVVGRESDAKPIRAMHGTTRSILENFIIGVTEGFEKRLVVEGIGFKANVKGDELVLEVGYSHPVVLPIPEGINVTAQKGIISVSGIDKQKVGQFAAVIRSKRVPDSYKGKGVRYEDEVLHLKPGKKAATAAAE